MHLLVPIFKLLNILIYKFNHFSITSDTDYADNPTFSMLNDTDEEDVVYG